jgi:threonine aldolase
MQFLSDNAAAVHPAVWAAMQAADAPQPPYDNDDLSRALDERFGDLYGRPAWALWTASGTAANCLALATMVPPHGGVVCHREAHIEADECGAPAFFTHGAKLILADGAGAKLTPAAVERVVAPIGRGVHQVQPHTLSLTQATECGLVYDPGEIAALVADARGRSFRVHVDGARFANAVAHLGCTPAEACGEVDAISFGCIKNGGMSADAAVFFDEAAADLARWRRKRAGHLQSKGRFLAAQIHALLDGDVWLANARHANAAAAELGAAVRERLLFPVEANEVFVRLNEAERAALRAQGFGFYDWGSDAARFVSAWNSPDADVAALARALAAL